MLRVVEVIVVTKDADYQSELSFLWDRRKFTSQKNNFVLSIFSVGPNAVIVRIASTYRFLFKLKMTF
jgi:hypothetical protein